MRENTLKNLTIEELEELAQEHNINISSDYTKNELMALIRKSREESEEFNADVLMNKSIRDIEKIVLSMGYILSENLNKMDYVKLITNNKLPENFIYTENDLAMTKLSELRKYATNIGVQSPYKYKKDDLIKNILSKQTYSLKRTNIKEDLEYEDNKIESESIEKSAFEKTKMTIGEDKSLVQGVLDLHTDGYGFLRVENYLSSEGDIYVSPSQIRRFRLKTGDLIQGIVKNEDNSNGNYNALIYVSSVNGSNPENAINRESFDSLTPIYPFEKITLEQNSSDLTTRLIDLISPIGKGQRGMIVSQPKSGKTTLMKKIAKSVAINHPEIHLIVLLIDERPEEVTDMKRSVKGEVVYSTFDEQPKNHIKVTEMVLERAKRLVEEKKDVMILLDSLTRLTRAYNITTPPSGKTLSGGLDPLSLHKPKRFFGAARKIEEGGSLTIIATSLIDTGSRMDDVIYEEFKGTGNMELHLDRDLSEMRVFPAVDIYKSGTRKEELLLSKFELEFTWSLRKAMYGSSTSEIAEKVLDNLEKTENNNEFVRKFKIN